MSELISDLFAVQLMKTEADVKKRNDLTLVFNGCGISVGFIHLCLREREFDLTCSYLFIP